MGVRCGADCGYNPGWCRSHPHSLRNDLWPSGTLKHTESINQCWNLTYLSPDHFCRRSLVSFLTSRCRAHSILSSHLNVRHCRPISTSCCFCNSVSSLLLCSAHIHMFSSLLSSCVIGRFLQLLENNPNLAMLSYFMALVELVNAVLCCVFTSVTPIHIHWCFISTFTIGLSVCVSAQGIGFSCWIWRYIFAVVGVKNVIRRNVPEYDYDKN